MYFNPPAPCGTGPDNDLWERISKRISIHPPLAGRDRALERELFSSSNFNPPAPCGTGHMSDVIGCMGESDFNPPAPCGTGRNLSAHRKWQLYFNPPAPCGTGLHRFSFLPHRRNFNPTAPCGTGLSLILHPTQSSIFQSTRPSRDGTYSAINVSECHIISIHPSLAGRDNSPAGCANTSPIFQSTRPSRDGTLLLPRNDP